MRKINWQFVAIIIILLGSTINHLTTMAKMDERVINCEKKDVNIAREIEKLGDVLTDVREDVSFIKGKMTK